jgi:hypothetical protein
MHQNKGIARLLAAGLFACAVLVPAGAGAQLSCIPFGNGGAYSPGPPQWFTAGSTTGWPRFNTWVDDPRWSGAMAINYGDGSTPELQFRGLYHPASGAGQYVYLSWWHKAALNGTVVNNRLYVGLKASAGATALLLRIQLSTAAHTTAGTPIITVHPVNADGTFGSAFPTNPAWTNDIRVWIEESTDQSTLIPPQANSQEPNNWAIHVRIPMGMNLGTAGNNVTLTSPFQMYFDLLQGTPAAPVISYTWPRSTLATPYHVTDGASGEQLPQTSAWPQFQLGLAAAATCPGVDIEPADIKVTYPGTSTDWQIKIGAANTFTATPVNLTGAAVPSGSVTARFRIANWGIQPATMDQADPATGAWTSVPGLGAVQQSPAASIANNGDWNLSGNWTPTAADFSGKSTHQCIQVELSGAAGVVFRRASAFRNMQVVPASLFTDSAEVSVVGLAPAAAPQRDVFLHVQTSNMPLRVGAGGRRYALQTVAVPGDTGGDRGAEKRNARTELERRFEKEPTYIVRGYYDTGLRLTIDGTPHPILQPMVAFGYFVDHEGSLTGWEHALTGAQQIAPNFYRVGVPNNGAVKIGIRIEALESGIFQGGGLPWWAWLLIALLVLLLVIWLIRRRSTP